MRASAVEDGGPAFLVKNVNRGADPRESSDVWSLTPAGDLVFFTADDGEHGRELWRADGTPEGTFRLTDINPGRADSIGWRPVPIGDEIAFTDDKGRLWRSDGSVQGTRLVFDGRVGGVAPAGDDLYFIGDGDLWGDADLWRLGERSDQPIRLGRFEAVGGAGTESCYHGRWIHLRASGNTLFAYAIEEHRPECGYFWSSAIADVDSASDGVFVLENASAEILVAGPIANGLFFFVGSGDEYRHEVWRSDGTTEGTFPVTAAPGTAGSVSHDSYPSAGLTVFQDRVYFVGYDPEYGRELWTTDGTVDGTRMVVDAVPGAEGLYPCPPYQGSYCHIHARAWVRLIALDDTMLIARRVQNDLMVWRTDGTAEGTIPVAGLVPNATLARDSIVSADGRGILFTAYDGESQTWLWHGDGTVSGSTRLAPTAVSSMVAGRAGFAFVASTEDAYSEPWWSDGTVEGTHPLGDLRRGDGPSDPRDLVDLDGLLLYSGDDGLHGRELWRSDGSSDGTYLVRDIAIGSSGSDPTEPVILGQRVLFAADDGEHGIELWASDGTGDGTTMVRDIWPGSGGSVPRQLTTDGSLVYFFADDGQHGSELWCSDGTVDGTFLLADVRADGGGGEYPNSWGGPYIAPLKGAVYFVADDGLSGVQLWRVDGPGETPLLFWKSEEPEQYDYPNGLLAYGDTLYFIGASRWWRTLYATNGEPGATFALGPPGTEIATPPEIEFTWRPVQYDGAVYFLGQRNDSRATEVWTTDGTPAGTRLTASPSPELETTGPPFVVNELVMLRMWNRSNLWRSDGTLLSDIGYDGSWTSDIQSLTNLGGKILFIAGRAYHDSTPRTLWTLTTEPDSATPLQTLPPTHHADSFHSCDDDKPPFVTSGRFVFFAGDYGETGTELWALPLDAVPDYRQASPTPSSSPTPTSSPTNSATPPMELPTATIALPSHTATAPPTATATASSTRSRTMPVPVLFAQGIAARQGESGTISVRMASATEQVVGLETLVTLDGDIEWRTTSAGQPACTVNPDLNKNASGFSFADVGCSPQGRCGKTVHALLLDFANFDPIPSNVVLFTCEVRVADDAGPGERAIELWRADGASIRGESVSIETRASSITVTDKKRYAEAAAGSELPAVANGGCQIQRHTPRPAVELAVLALLPLLVVASTRRSRQNGKA